MRVIVTRPAAQAAAWVDSLRAQAIDAVALPLIGIAPAADPAPLRAAWAALPGYRLVVFVSPNAAEHFFAARPGPARPAAPGWPTGTLAGSPGPGTTQVLARLGVPAGAVVAPAADAAQFDSESLWAALEAGESPRADAWQGRRALIVRGDGGREWLADTLRARGAEVDLLCAYHRRPPRWTAAEASILAAALDRPAAHVWLLSSSEAVDHLDAATAGRPAPPRWDESRALASHPRIAERARRLGFGSVTVVPPLQAAILACLQSPPP